MSEKSRSPRHRYQPPLLSAEDELSGNASYLANKDWQEMHKGAGKGGRHKLESPKPARSAIGATAIARMMLYFGIRKA